MTAAALLTGDNYQFTLPAPPADKDRYGGTVTAVGLGRPGQPCRLKRQSLLKNSQEVPGFEPGTAE